MVAHPGCGAGGASFGANDCGSGRLALPHHQAVSVLLDRKAAIHIAMINWSSCEAVERDPERVSGAWVFRGTRVPVAALFQNLEDGATVNDFLAWFPGPTEDQVRAVLEYAAKSLEVV